MTAISATGAPAATPPARRPIFDWLFGLAVLGMVGAFARIFLFTPADLRQGLAQKIYYIHISSAITAYLGFGIVFVTSVIYLWLRDERTDRLAEAAAEVGLLFMTIVLTTGPIWGKTTWGTWWTWDARLTLSLFLWFVYAGFLTLRGAVEEPAMRARYSAVLGVLGALLIPFIHLSVYLFRTLHPMPVILQPARPGLPPVMLKTFLLTYLALTVLFLALLRARYRYAVERDALHALEQGEGRA